ncbi:hypothetical protein BOTCAL_0380g00060 [Botryotinia calthae]|uniref:Transmembrane protein n=1 Tax=Botryotinia calthae TaxID=38488 RepID=A0A4Y8CT90_9HELO|nr:hypothetical protein BOTCAL_0380g00060 [Botryotinia calthae]
MPIHIHIPYFRTLSHPKKPKKPKPPTPTTRSIGTQTTNTRTHSSRWTQTPSRYISFHEQLGVRPPRKSGIERLPWYAVLGGVVLGWFWMGIWGWARCIHKYIHTYNKFNKIQNGRDLETY